ncbi:general amino acid permease-like protein AGP2 [Bimuria novae-zelandiae CBS 107.79]|uniref:General amino acid permease-like protein AGP2 n=1 Tax=Bimuria novae-zelandiae CBS 107.79 TaxID=1447943 RepID=A0A6A5VE00_9PLEO|nr:general amino acid permease-like protein AGP2 [Bimuria novae-zelandiae CBS 107.79]
MDIDESKKYGSHVAESPNGNGEKAYDVQHGETRDNSDELQRHLGNRQIQLIAIGGSIGTALFVSIGGALNKAGPGSLLMAYTFYSIVMGCVNNSIAEMSVYMPVSGGFVRLAGHWVDEALGFAAGWNFFFYEALLIPFEITALHTVLGFWRDDIPVWGVAIAVIILYAACNVLAVQAYGEAEFWLSGGKVILIFMLYCFTFITMVGGNPRNDAYGFRYWNKPGSMRAYLAPGTKGEFEGFLAALWAASFCIVGPEYISMVAGEAKRPRTYIKNAYKTVYWRYGIFFILGALCTGIVVPWNDTELDAVNNGGKGAGTAAASPYVIAMTNLTISVLPDITNALLVTSIFSAGNTYTYAASRSLYSLAVQGHAPRFLRKCTRNGVPIWCFAITMCFPFLSFMAVSSASNEVLTWLVGLLTAAGVIDFIIMMLTYIAFYKATQAQGIDRKTLPYYGWFQPYQTYFALAFEICVMFVSGYRVFLPGNFTYDVFFTTYTMVGVTPCLYVFWKLVKRTKIIPSKQVDLSWDAPLIDAYEASFISPPTGFWTEMIQLLGFRRGVRDDVRNV